MSDWTQEELEAPVSMPPVPADKEVFIQIKGLHKRFGPRHILRGIDLDVYKGETLVVLGTSGSGKSTLFKHIMGTHSIDEGTVRVGPFDLNNMPDKETWDKFRSNMGVVFQMAALLGSLTVYENVGLPLIEVDRIPEDEIRARVITALRSVYLPAEEILGLKPNELSGGMRKRVGLARAIIQNPELILYDEPTTGLDPVTVNGVNELTLNLQEKLGVTSLVITHDMSAAFTIADRIAMLYNGRIVACGSKEEIKENPHPVLRQLVTGSTRGPLTADFVT